LRDLIGALVDGRTILDLGCGDGSLSIQFGTRAASLTLVDFSEAMLDRARALVPAKHASHVEFVCSDLMHFNPGRRYDIVLCIGVLAHVESVQHALDRISDFVQPGGYCILQFTDSDKLSGKFIHQYDDMRRKLTGASVHRTNRTAAREVLRRAETCGFMLEKTQYYLPLIPGIGRLPANWGHYLSDKVFSKPWFSFMRSEALYLMHLQQ
jgi:2-polyprenyl-3-methyl-5-hydroxy-6-metoxy-1,4-benzoquinol methylase